MAQDIFSLIAPYFADRASRFALKPAHPHRLFNDRPQPIADYHARLNAIHDGSIYGNVEQLVGLIRIIIADATRDLPRDLSGAMHAAAVEFVQELLIANGLAFQLPAIDPLLLPDPNYALPLRRQLEEYEPLLVHREHVVQTFGRIASAMLSGIAHDYLPDAAFGDQDSAISVPLLALIKNPRELVEQIVATFINQDQDNTTEPYSLSFWKTRNQLGENLLAASGLTFEQAHKNPHRVVPPSSSDLPTEELAETYLANTPFLQLLRTPVPFAIPRHAYRAHGCIFAPSDHGKTQTLQALIAGFLQEPDPPALFIMDSMGSMLRKLERLQLFEDRLQDRLLVLDPTGPNPPRLNFFKLAGGSPAQQTELLFYLFKALDQSFTARQRTAVVFLGQLLQQMDGTLDDLRKICEEKQPRHLAAINALPPIARDFFLNSFYKPDALMTQTKQQIAARLYTLAATPLFEMFSAKHSTFNAFDCIQQKKIVLVNTDRLALGEEGSTIFGRFVIAQVLAAAFARAPIPEDKRHLALLIVDEAKAYLDEQAEKFLSDARQFWVGLLLATQYVHQLEEGVRRAVYGNTAIKLIGPIEYSDRVNLAREMHTTPEFIGSMRAYDQSHTEWAAYVRTSNMTPHALRLRVPYGILERMPQTQTPHAAQTHVFTNVTQPADAALPDADFTEPPATSTAAQTQPTPQAPHLTNTLDANTRIEKALRLLTPPLRTLIETELRRLHNEHWRDYVSIADGSDATQPLDPYAALKTLLDNWQSCFKDKLKNKTRTDVSKALEGRNAIAHTGDEISSADAIAYLIAIRDIATAISADGVTDTVKTFIEDQIASAATTTLRTDARPSMPPVQKPLLKPGKDW